MTKKSLLPTFDKLRLDIIMTHTNYSMNLQLDSSLRWTPLIQKIAISNEFQSKMLEFARKLIITRDVTMELIDAFIFEGIYYKHTYIWDNFSKTTYIIIFLIFFFIIS